MSEIRRLQTFLDFVRLGTIAAVADATQYSTSAVSQQLERLARDVGVELLRPHGRTLRLTSAGEALAERAPALLGAWEQLHSDVTAVTDEVRGLVSVAAFQSACLALLPPLLSALRETAPGVRVRCVQAEPDRAITALRSREIDVAVIERFAGQSSAPHADLVETLLGEDEMLLALPAGADPVRELSQLAATPWVFEERGGPERVWAEAMCHAAGFVPQVAHETSDVVMRCSLVAAGEAATFVPALTPEALRLGVECVTVSDGQSRELFAVTRQSSNADLAVQAVVRELGDTLGRLPHERPATQR